MQGTRMQRVTIYFGESDRYGDKALYQSLLELLRAEGALGATVTRAVAGFGAHSRIHTASLVELSSDLPLRLEWIDAPEQVERLMPELRTRVNDGLIVLEPIDVMQYSGGRQADPLSQPVSTVMRRGVTAATVDMPIAEVANLLLARGYRALPVLDADDKVVGMISDGDLLQLAGLKVRLGLQGDLSPAVLRQQFAELAQQEGTAGDYMTTPAVTVAVDAPIREAVQRMLDRHLKRLPVVEETGRLAGLVTRIEVLRLADYNLPASSRTKRQLSGATISELMETSVPTVAPTATLNQVLSAMEESHQRRVLVVDDELRVLGMITDGDILERSRQGDSPGLLSRLRSAVSGEPATTIALPERDETAVNLMSMPVTTVDVDAPLFEALDQMLWYGYKRLPVVDKERRLVGLLGRASLLRALMRDA
jgi:CBS-domain-containing membrane protein/PII-like signaling protein